MGAVQRAGRSRSLGAAGEKVAAELLRGRGYRVLGAGFLARRGEIDLVCRRGSELVVVEVKTRRSDALGAPLEAVGPRKRRALERAAAEYRALAEWRGPIHYVVVSLLMDADGSVRSADVIEDPF
ncbi:MAG TPA: YraN family protein [Candidatus Acidoferrales bacterium]|nr:YraN family protein [Candidatus Acidoferrales bacterium]